MEIDASGRVRKPGRKPFAALLDQQGKDRAGTAWFRMAGFHRLYFATAKGDVKAFAI